MEKKFNSEQPKKVVYKAPKYILNYGIYQLEESELQEMWEKHQELAGEIPSAIDENFRDNHRYAYYQVQIPMGQWTYEGIVNAIIRDKYSVDAMEAITNNMAAVTSVFLETLVTDGIISATKYLVDSIDPERTQAFKEMQEWRKMAKEVAKSIIKQ
jgi:hypothetical protein